MRLQSYRDAGHTDTLPRATRTGHSRKREGHVSGETGAARAATLQSPQERHLQPCREATTDQHAALPKQSAPGTPPPLSTIRARLAAARAAAAAAAAAGNTLSNRGTCRRGIRLFTSSG